MAHGKELIIPKMKRNNDENVIRTNLSIKGNLSKSGDGSQDMNM